MPKGRWASRRLLLVALTACLAVWLGASAWASESSPPPRPLLVESFTFNAPPAMSLDRQLFGEPEAGKAGWPANLIHLWGPMQMQITFPPPDRQELQKNPQFSSKIYLPHNTELRVSFLYKKDPSEPLAARSVQSHVLLKYSMDYRVMPNLQVGVSGYFYQQQFADVLYWNNKELRESIMGLGPALKYDLGRWSFMVRSQLETSTSTRERNEGINSWFRVWYSF